MSYQVLARKYRPQKFSDVIGQEHVTRTLQNAIAQGRIAHGYIFSGHRGIGKTTVARILAMALNCRSAEQPVSEPCGACESCTEIRAGNAVDVIEIDAATNRGIDEIRELREAARYRPARDRFKIYILDEAHQITDAAFNALLKTLEEPPGHVIFMMATTQPEDIPQTIRSRCQHFSYRAMKFDAIMGQLRDIVAKESIPADDEALALLAEAGDGSMRDALSILDQAIASTGDRLTLDSVRGLIGAAPCSALETLMQAVGESASDKLLMLVDELITEGHSPTHFARQLVRFLRNVTVAKIAGADSPLLQISSDERARAGRVATLFSEEELARHLQIMLRTHGELGYRQEQRFLLELGLLKMAHAQRLLPIEQLLSEAAPASGGTPRPGPLKTGTGKNLSGPTEERRPGLFSSAKSSSVSPFAADSARKSGPTAESSDVAAGFAGSPAGSSAATPAVTMDRRSPNTADGTARPPQSLAPLVIMGSTAPAIAEPTSSLDSQPVEQTDVLTDVGAKTSSAVTPEAKSVADDAVDSLRLTALNALANQQMLVSILETAEWKLVGSTLTAKAAASATMIEMTFTAEARRIASAAITAAAGHPIRMQLEPGGITQTAPAPRRASNGSARSRAEQDPIVQRMKEKFGAEIRTVIDYREKGS